MTGRAFSAAFPTGLATVGNIGAYDVDRSAGRAIGTSKLDWEGRQKPEVGTCASVAASANSAVPLLQRHILDRVERIVNARKAGIPELERAHKAALFALLAVKRDMRGPRLARPTLPSRDSRAAELLFQEGL